MNRPRPEPVELVKKRRDDALTALIADVPYIRFIGIEFDRRGDELTGILPYKDTLIGNPMLPALHGGATSAFMEITAMITLSWHILWEQIESGELTEGALPRLPKTAGLTVDYLRSGLPRDSYARARVVRRGRRYATVHVEGWQDNRDRLYAQATGHFVMPPRTGRDA